MSIWSRLWKSKDFLQLDEVLALLEPIQRRLDRMGSDIQALDNAVAKLTDEVADVKIAVEALIAALPPGDFTTEIEAVNNAFASLGETAQEARDATTTPPPAEPI